MVVFVEHNFVKQMDQKLRTGRLEFRLHQRQVDFWILTIIVDKGLYPHVRDGMQCQPQTVHGWVGQSHYSSSLRGGCGERCQPSLETSLRVEPVEGVQEVLRGVVYGMHLRSVGKLQVNVLGGGEELV